MGNTCYMNSSLQALRSIPELNEALKNYKSPTGGLTGYLRDMFNKMSSTSEAFYPLAFLNSLRIVYPQFAEKGRDGMYKQQDAEEAFSQLVGTLKGSLINENESFIEKYFQLYFEETIKCDELPDEEAVIKHESSLKLSAHISKDVNFLRDGLLLSLQDKLTKNNSNLGRDSIYSVERKLENKLPKYLTINYVRFFWKRETQKKSKILRKVVFPFELDISEFCNNDLKSKLIQTREAIRDVNKEKLELIRSAKKARKQQQLLEVNSNKESDSSTSNIISKSKEEEFKNKVESTIHPDFRNDDGCNVSPLYELFAIVSHKGASADSGHYQAFIKDDKDENSGTEKENWWKFNDDKVTQVNREKIESLAGGGESDSALLLLYRAVKY